MRGALRPQEVLFLSRLNYRTRAALALRNYRYATAQGHHGFAAAQPSWLVAPNFTAAQVRRVRSPRNQCLLGAVVSYTAKYLAARRVKGRERLGLAGACAGSAGTCVRRQVGTVAAAAGG